MRRAALSRRVRHRDGAGRETRGDGPATPRTSTKTTSMIGASRAGQATLAALLSGLLLIAVACGQGGTQVGGSYSTINGIACDLGERLAFHIHAHVAIYANGQPLTVPYGIGIWGQPLSSSQAASATGPVIAYVNGEQSSG